MAIEQNLKKIKQAVLGGEVRDAIHDAIHECYEDGHAGSTDLIARERIEVVSDDTSNKIRRTQANLTVKDIAGKAMAHRGYGWDARNDRIHFPGVCENTIRAYQLAFDNGYEIMEIDLQKDVNDVVCVFHDNTVDGVTTGTGYLKDLDYTTLYLKDGDGNVTTEKIITFAQACRWASSTQTILCAEIKYGTNIKSVTIADMLDIADRFGTQVIVNCNTSTSLLNECSSQYPSVWKMILNYATDEIDTDVIDNLVAAGHKNLLLYNEGVNANYDGIAEKYGYERDILLCKVIANFSTTNNQTGFGVLFCVGDGRPNYKSPIVYDSGWITVADSDLQNSYSTVGDNWRLRYRRIGNVVYVRGLFVKTNWDTTDALSDVTKRSAYTLPVRFRPEYTQRAFTHAGDGLIGRIMTEVNTYGTVQPAFKLAEITAEQLNANYLPLFIEYPVANIPG